MNSVERAIRAGVVGTDTEERLVCQDCGMPLETHDHDRVGWRRSCPNCGRMWKQVHETETATRTATGDAE
ncbi:HVO_0758 family zinc finger protein [Halobacterium bonnevillei]